MNEAAKKFICDLLVDGYKLTRATYRSKRLLIDFDITKGLVEPHKENLLSLLNNGQIMAVDLNEQELNMLFFAPDIERRAKTQTKPEMLTGDKS